MNHDKSPWKHDGDGNISVCDDQLIAFVNLTAYKTGKANASLITAAPDLLEALANMVVCFERFEDTHTALVMEAARAAIDKATSQ